MKRILQNLPFISFNIKKKFGLFLLLSVVEIFTLSNIIATTTAVILSPSAAKLDIFTSLAVEAYFIEKIGGDHVNVSILVGSGRCPETFSLRPSQLEALSKAQLYFSTSFPFEGVLIKKLSSSLPHLTVIDLRKNLKLRTLSLLEDQVHAKSCSDRQCTHQHVHTGKYDDTSKDPHIWISPKMVMVQIQTIRDALTQADPQNAAFYDKNYLDFKKQLENLDAYLSQALQSLKGQSIFVYHPSYGYLADEYGFTQVPVEVDGKIPTPRKLAELINQANQDKVHVIFVEPQSSDRSASVIAQAIGGQVVTLDVLAPDYLKNMYELANKLQTIFSKTSNLTLSTSSLHP